MEPNLVKELFTIEREILNHALRGCSTSISLPKPNTNVTKMVKLYDGGFIRNSLS